MTAQLPESFLTAQFIDDALNALAKHGFISDEHSFAPYRETLVKHIRVIEQALLENGFDGRLGEGFVKHSEAGYAYFVYDSERYEGLSAAQKAVTHWLDKKYGN